MWIRQQSTLTTCQLCHNGSEHQRKKTNVSFTLHDWNYSRKWFIVAAFFLFRIAPTICNCFTCYKYPRWRCFIIVYAEIFFVASQHIWKKKLKSLNESTENTLIIINFVDKLGPIKMFRFGSFANYCLSFSPTWTKSFFSENMIWVTYGSLLTVWVYAA